MPDPSSRKARVIGSRLDCLNLRLQGWNRTSIATACMGDAGGTERVNDNETGDWFNLSLAVLGRFEVD